MPALEPSGYAHSAYAESLAAFGRPLRLPESGGWVLCRDIPGTPYRDAMGGYPLFACTDWAGLGRDLAALEGRLVSLSLVTDPFGAFDPAWLDVWFAAVCRPFKQHFTIDLARPPADFVSPHHRRNARKAAEHLRVELCATPTAQADEWTRLYAGLVARHAVAGMAAFPPAALRAQLAVPGLVMTRARAGEETVGMVLWLRQGEVAYYHLGAYSPRGYAMGASFALFDFAIGHFAASGLRWLSLGAGAGLDGTAEDGLTRFKRGWSSGTRTAYFCGRILDPAAYAALARSKGGSGTGYFPAYREGEFA